MRLTLLLIGWLSLTASYAQIGIGGTPHPSAVLDLKTPGNNKGLLMPRVTTAQRLTIPQPAQGLLVYDLDKAALFLYDRANWLPLATTETANLLPIDRMASDATADDGFGYSVAISGDYAVVGAYLDDVDIPDQGSVYVFARVNGTWTQQAQLTASDRESGDKFGFSGTGRKLSIYQPAGNIEEMFRQIGILKERTPEKIQAVMAVNNSKVVGKPLAVE